MSSRLWLSIALTIVGASLPLAAGAAAAGGAKSGGSLTYDWSSDFQSMDPQVAFYQQDWAVLQATCLRLLNWPDVNGPKAAQLQPEAATGFPKISNGGKTYDFTVDVPWTKFYPGGKPVTAANFKAAFERIGDPKLQSPAEQFFTDVVGMEAKAKGKARSVSGVRVEGEHLIIELTKPAPDFLARVGLVSTCAVPTNLPDDPNGTVIPPMAGPYYIASWDRGRQLVLERNPDYKGARPHDVDRITMTIGNSSEATQLRIEKGQADLGAIPAVAYAGIAKRYGVNERRFFVYPTMRTWYLGLNHDRSLFGKGGPAGNVALAKAVNYALDRHALTVQRGFDAGRRTDQLLPPNMPGFVDAHIYPTVKQPNVALAKKLAAGHTGDGKAVLYGFTDTYGPLWSQIVQFDLKQIGLDVRIVSMPRSVQVAKIETKGEPFDLAIDGWGADYADPQDFLNVLLYGPDIKATGNKNVSYFDDPAYDKKLLAASTLSGRARYAAYGALDVDVMRNAAPFAPILNENARYFVSARLGCMTFQPVLGVPDLAALCVR